MQVAHIYAKLSYCKRRQVGCIIVKDNRIISIGYNGTPPGWDNVCEDETGMTFPYVYHAEANAISKLARSNESGDKASIFTTVAPCLECAKLMAQLGICEVYYTDLYRGGTERGEQALVFLKKCGIRVERLDTSFPSNPPDNDSLSIVMQAQDKPVKAHEH
ncbi:dCMP deaminase [Spirochaetota bacterium]|nr:dCMP deaminase [Spirochaetota bacterium]